MKRAEIVVGLKPASEPAGVTTRSIMQAAGVRGFSLEQSASFGGPPPESERTRFRLPLAQADLVIASILALPGVIDARIAHVDDYPPDDEPPSGVREPRNPLPPSGHMAAEADDE